MFNVLFTEIDCGPPNPVENTTVEISETTYRSIATYICLVTFQYESGSGSVECLSVGEWSIPTIICIGGLLLIY